MTLKNTHVGGDPIRAEDMNSQVDAIIDNQHNIFQLYLENIFASKVTPFQGMFFDGFSDETKKDIATGASINAAEKRLELGGIITLGTHSIDLEEDSTQYLSITDAAQTALNFTGDFTLEAWINIESVASDFDLNILAKHGVSGNFGYAFFFSKSGGVGRLFTQLSSNGTAQTGKFINADSVSGEWHHAAMIYDASAGEVEFVFDGISIGTVTGLPTSIFDNSFEFRVGNVGANQSMDGKIDDPRAWSLKRTVAEILANKDTELTGSETGLEGYWKLNNDLLDETANNNDLTNNNGAVFSTDVPSIPSFDLTGLYESIVSSFQQSMTTARLWVVRNFTDSSDKFNLAAGISAGATTLTITGDQTGAFANGDTIDISDENNLVRERKTLTAVPSFGGGVTTLTFSATTNAFTTSDFAERVNVLPEISLVDVGTAKSFQTPTFVRSVVGTGATGNGIDIDDVEDEYLLDISPSAEEDLKVKLNLSRNDAAIDVHAKRLGVVVNT